MISSVRIRSIFKSISSWLPITLSIGGGFLLLLLFLLVIQIDHDLAHADPIMPPEGYPKLSASIKTVSPSLVKTGGEELTYIVEIRNTGAYTASETTLTDVLPEEVNLNEAESNVPPAPNFDGTTLSWDGEIGFDQTVVISFNVTISASFSGEIVNTAVISNPMVDESVSVVATSMVTDDPIFTIDKTSYPDLPGANKPISYTIIVANEGQPAINLPITVTDQVPTNTIPRSVGDDGTISPDESFITWNRTVNLETGEKTAFVFSVNVGAVPSGTIIANEEYQVESQLGDVTAGKILTTTVVEPEFWLVKEAWPDPPGSNRHMTYTLTLLNIGSMATNLVITDRVPANVTYESGGNFSDGVVSWTLPYLGSNETAEVSFSVYISDVMDITIVNDSYGVCSEEGVCQQGSPVSNIVQGPTFEAWAEVDPIAKKPGGSSKVPLTPTLVVHNLGPGNAFDAHVLLQFDRISAQGSELVVIPDVGTLSDPDKCGSKCEFFTWQGDIGYGETITFTTLTPMSTIGGEEGTAYTATVVVSDTLANMATEPVTATAVGHVTHLANLIPEKSAPPVIGNGMLMTYTISVWNSGLSTDEPPLPTLMDTVPASVTLERVNDGGAWQTVSDTTIVSWTLPAMSPGDVVDRSYVVRIDDDLVSGTLIVNDNYRTSWYEIEDKEFFTNTGQPVTTTVSEVGLIDSFKEVTPTLIKPGPDNILTYTLNIVNSSPNPLYDVSVYDYLPWQDSTYQRDAIATSGQIISDIVSIKWIGDVGAFSSELVTFTILVDDGFEGTITNTAVISHTSLAEEIWISVQANVTDKPILQITKQATPGPVEIGDEIQYQILLQNQGQKAIGLFVVDEIPNNTSFVQGSANVGGFLSDNQVQWQWPILDQNESKTFTFKVLVDGGRKIVNDKYNARTTDGVIVWGLPVVTTVASGREGELYLPAILKK